MSRIEIHEFSTGIEVKGTPTAWESGGFTGEYMNRTIDPIPQTVLDSIANREFALAEGVVKAEPAIVGRVVKGNDGEIWSVVAVVTRGRDDRGRGVSLYRYFLCQNDGHIETILRWMGQPPREFDPFEKRVIGQPHQANFNPKEVRLDKLEKVQKMLDQMLDQSPPIVFSATERCMPLILNEITRILKPSGDRSWAYKVAMLERPESFQVIYPANSEAEKVISEVLKRRQSSSALISGESDIKTAIGVVINGRVKRKHIETLENALTNPQLDEKYWTSILDKEGALQAIREKVYGDRSVRLLTLKAMLVPTFLPDFLTWLANSKESEKHYNTSLKLQERISRETKTFTEDFPELSKHLKKGICRVIDRLVDQPKIFKELELLLTSQSGLWGQVYPSLSEELENVLNEIKQRQNWQSLENEYPQWSSLLKTINKFWYPQILHDHSDKKLTKYYKNLTELFEKLETTKLAAIFYQIGEGSVPKSVFLEVSGNKGKKNTVLVLGMEINRRQEIGDYVKEVCCFLFKTVDIGGINMPGFIALMILLVVFTGGFTLGRFSGQLFPGVGVSTGKANNNDQKNGKNQESTVSDNNDNDKTEDDQEETQKNPLSEENADKYKQTDEAIEGIKNELTSEIEELAQYNHNVLYEVEIPSNFYENLNDIKTKDIIIHCIKKRIGLKPDFQYSKIKEDNEKWKDFSNAIKEYQKPKFNNPDSADGVISPKGKTQEWLKEDIRKYLKIEDSLELQNPQFSSPITVPQ